MSVFKGNKVNTEHFSDRQERATGYYSGPYMYSRGHDSVIINSPIEPAISDSNDQYLDMTSKANMMEGRKVRRSCGAHAQLSQISREHDSK
jgi:hypothetical protein